MTDRRYITLVAGGRRVRALRGDGPPTLAGGVGGWEEVAHPRQVSSTQWRGSGPFRLTLPLLFDGFRDERSVEADCAALEAMGLAVSGGPPPTITVDGAVPHAELDWVIPTDGLEWGDAIYHEAGYRLRQAVTVTLLEFVRADRVQLMTAAERVRAQEAAKTRAAGGGGPGVAARIVTAKDGDTLGTIAVRLWSDFERWRDLAKLNGLRDPYRKLRAGQPVRVA